MDGVKVAIAVSRMAERLQSPGSDRNIRRPSGKFSSKGKYRDLMLAGILDSGSDVSASMSKGAEIISRGTRRVFPAPDPATPAEKEVRNRYGRPVAHPAQVQNNAIKNYPVTNKNSPVKAASYAAFNEMVSYQRVRNERRSSRAEWS